MVQKLQKIIEEEMEGVSALRMTAKVTALLTDALLMLSDRSVSHRDACSPQLGALEEDG